MGRTSPPTMVNFPRQIIDRPKEDRFHLNFMSRDHSIRLCWWETAIRRKDSLKQLRRLGSRYRSSEVLQSRSVRSAGEDGRKEGAEQVLPAGLRSVEAP